MTRSREVVTEEVSQSRGSATTNPTYMRCGHKTDGPGFHVIPPHESLSLIEDVHHG